MQPETHRYAAIDVGSNAIRLLLARVWQTEKSVLQVKKDTFFRMPLRLGTESFAENKLSRETKFKLMHTMMSFGHAIKAYQPEEVLAYATSAMRELKNGDRIVKEIKKKSNIDLEIISGQKEADIIYGNHIENMIADASNFLYIDVGGGSTELTFYSKGVSKNSKSFKIGTVRMLKGLIDKETWETMREWVIKTTVSIKNIEGIGSGGNIAKIRSLVLDDKYGQEVSYKKIKKIEEKLQKLTYDQRIYEMGLKPDRADVIVPACKIYRSVMQWGNIKKIFVPSIGLVDGMIIALYERVLKKKEF